MDVGNDSDSGQVVLLAEDVDRNNNGDQIIPIEFTVVLLAEDVDRNRKCCIWWSDGARRPPRGGRG